MKRTLLTSLLAMLSIAGITWAQTEPSFKPGVPIKIVTDRPAALYPVGQPVIFQVTLAPEITADGPREIHFVLSHDGADQLAQGTWVTAGNSLSITGKLTAPGFLRCQVSCTGSGKTEFSALAATGIEPLRIKPSLPVPVDFDAYWRTQKQKLAEVPLKPVLTPVPSPSPDVDCFDVQVQCAGGAPVSGYLARPKGARPHSLPAILSVHGAGVRSSILATAVKDARYGALGMDMNAHGIPNGRPSEFYEELIKGRLANYRHEGRENRDTYYFRGMYLRLVRALEFLRAQPEWDGHTLIVHGASQGGGQSIVAAGLDSHVTAIVAHIPAMCDHTGQICGWPKLVPHGHDGQPDPQISEVARYYDAMNFATRTTAEALVTVGFIDDTSRPTSVYAAYNNWNGPKQILNRPLMTHAVLPECSKAEADFIQTHIRKLSQHSDLIH